VGSGWDSMATPNVLVLYGHGINCDRETAYGFELAGANAERVHLNTLKDGDDSIRDYQILALPGGFSYGDDIHAGKILAVELNYKLGDDLRRFIDDGKLIIGICNGFQAQVKSGMLPATDGDYRKQTVTLTDNDSGRFIDNWVYLEANPESPCVFTRGVDGIYLPIRHGEGKFVPGPGILEKLKENNQIAFRYKPGCNPNGSIDDIAGICDPTGRIFGMMPHPEAFLFPENHPRWTREKVTVEDTGRRIFQNAVDYWK